MPRNTLALRIPLNDEPIVETVDDIDACNLVYSDVDDDPDIVEMIEQEYCFHRDDRQHLYLNGAVHCCACGMAHPSIRNACGQR